ncbi:MAG: PleD family two-component system response regulator [Rhizobiales bacterium]|nr:PleD family two-component system response regulator [Hyphomicrobiales bacterium]
MTARVLVVDDILANVRLLEAKLTAEYFEVVTAMNGVDALEAVQRTKPDIILLDVMMPGMDGIEVCSRIKQNPATHHIPIIMVTALDQPEDRVRGLEAGADDFLTKPVNDVALFCRVKSLVRLKMLTDELRSRMATGEDLGLTTVSGGCGDPEAPADVLLIDNRGHLGDRIASAFDGQHQLVSSNEPQEAVIQAAEAAYELIIVNLDLQDYDGLRLCSQLRSLERTRQVPILIIVDPDDDQRLMRALDMGVNDYLLRPIDRQELLARVNTQIKRWRYTERLRQSVQQSLEMAVTDPLTGLFNRRYMENQVGILVENSLNRGKSLAVLTIDVDHFKAVNDTYGHAAGDNVLVELAKRIKDHVRSVDLPCRVGGEEFLVVLPDTDIAAGYAIAERLRQAVGNVPFAASEAASELAITISIGVADLEDSKDTLEAMLKRADDALYKAKAEGRNRVIADAA